MPDFERPTVRTRQGRQVLAIPLGPDVRQRALAALGALQNSPGYIVRENRCRQWRVEGLFQEAGASYFYGPAEDGLLLEEILSYGLDAALSYLQRLLAALITLEQQGLAHFELQSDGVLFLRAGGVLFLPPPLMSRIRETRPLAYRLEVHELLNHPDLKRRLPEQLSFSIAVMLYTLLCGRPPFQGGLEEEIHGLHQRMRSLRPPPPETAAPGLKREVSDTIMRGLGKAPGNPPTLSDYRRGLEHWTAEGFFTAVTESEAEQLRRRGAQLAARADTAWRRSLFWRRHGRRIALIALAVLAGGGLGASWLRNVLAPPATRGLPPQELVSVFYRSINTLDHTLMDDCTAGRAGRETIREVTQTYVVTRVSGAYEGENRFLPADDWDRRGRPPVTPPLLLFGITGLSVTPLKEELPGKPEAQGEQLFLVRYENWRSGAAEEGEEGSAGRIAGVRVEERVTVRKKGKDWVIVRIERLGAEPLGP
jgi:hypothetical protein